MRSDAKYSRNVTPGLEFQRSPPLRRSRVRVGALRSNMRVRVLGQYLQISVGALALIEALLFVGAFYGATMARFGLTLGTLDDLERGYGSLWPRAVLFSAVMLICLLAFCLYCDRQCVR